MPHYTFRNKKTNKIFDKELSLNEHEQFIKDKNIEQIIKPFKIGNLISHSENKLREEIWNKSQQAKKKPDYKINGNPMANLSQI